MDIQAIENYICEKKRIEMPVLQEQFALSYSDTVKVLTELEKNGSVKFCDGFTYELNVKKINEKSSVKANNSLGGQEAIYIKALWECIKSDCAATSIIQSKCSVGYAVAVKAIDWMEKNGFVSKMNGPLPRIVLISQDDFVKRFGNPDDNDLEKGEDIERRRREILERLSHMEDSKDEESEEDEDNDDEIDKVFKERREYLEKRRQELIERMQREMFADEEDVEDHDITAEALRNEIQQMPYYNADDDTFSIKMEVKYPDGMPFRVKVVEHGGRFYLSDFSDTLKYLSSFNDKNSLAKYFQDTLKNENLCFIEDAVCTTLDDIHDLSGEAAFLFKVVNGLITQKYFDIYYLDKESIKLANDILQDDDAALLVNAISILSEKPLQVTVLQKQLHIGRVRANQIDNTLVKLGVLSPKGVKSDKITTAFVDYLRRMLDNNNGE